MEAFPATAVGVLHVLPAGNAGGDELAVFVPSLHAEEQCQLVIPGGRISIPSGDQRALVESLLNLTFSFSVPLLPHVRAESTLPPRFGQVMGKRALTGSPRRAGVVPRPVSWKSLAYTAAAPVSPVVVLRRSMNLAFR
jgi:hypothetical protein